MIATATNAFMTIQNINQISTRNHAHTITCRAVWRHLVIRYGR